VSKDQDKASRSKMRAACQHCLQPAWRMPMHGGSKPWCIILGQLGVNTTANHVIVSAIASKRRERVSKGFHGGGHAPWFEDGDPILGGDPQRATVETNDAHFVLGKERFNAFPAPIRATCWPFDGHVTPFLIASSATSTNAAHILRNRA
jgi:hypothetical protein